MRLSYSGVIMLSVIMSSAIVTNVVAPKIAPVLRLVCKNTSNGRSVILKTSYDHLKIFLQAVGSNLRDNKHIKLFI